VSIEIWYALAGLLILVGLAGTILPAVPGVPLVFAGMLLAAWAGDFSKVSVWTVVLLGVLTAAAVALEFVASAVGAKRSGASWLAFVGAGVGTLIGAFAGVVEIVPVIGPLTAGAVAVGVGLTVSWHLALAAGIAVLVVRLLEDYIVLPRVLGDAVGLSPLIVLFSVAAVALLFGGFAVLLAIPIAAVLATLVDVVVRGKDPAEEDVPAVIFSAKDIEAG